MTGAFVTAILTAGALALRDPRSRRAAFIRQDR